MPAAVRTVALAALVTLAWRPALAGTGDPGNDTPTDTLGNAQPDSGSVTVHVPDTIVIHSVPDRSGKNIAILASLAGAGALVGGLGLWAHLESRAAVADVSAADFTHTAWTPARQAEEDRANRDATRAAVGYGIGGALLIAAVVALIVTAPAEETTVIQPHVGAAPTPGGASVSAAWSF